MSRLRELLWWFISVQIRLSNTFDYLLPEKYRIDGNSHFNQEFVRPYLREGITLYDVGGGKLPLLSIQEKQDLKLKVVGLDIDKNELSRAPKGAYDQIVCADIIQFRGSEDADMIVCQAVLEHVQDNNAAFIAIYSMLKPGGVALIFLPSRNAIYARLNLIMPEKLKKKILFAIFPQTEGKQGFPSFYNKCTPKDFRELAELNNLVVEEQRNYYTCSYFSFCFPLHLVCRLWTFVFYLCAGEQAAETFSMAIRKRLPQSNQ